MDGEKKFLAVLFGVTVICITILYSFLFISLWQYKEWVGASLLALIILVVGLRSVVNARGKMTEQDLRQTRIMYHTEIPLDQQGEPMYWPEHAQQNPNRTNLQQQYNSYSQPKW